MDFFGSVHTHTHSRARAHVCLHAFMYTCFVCNHALTYSIAHILTKHMYTFLIVLQGRKRTLCDTSFPARAAALLSHSAGYTHRDVALASTGQTPRPWWTSRCERSLAPPGPRSWWRESKERVMNSAGALPHPKQCSLFCHSMRTSCSELATPYYKRHPFSQVQTFCAVELCFLQYAGTKEFW